MRHGVAILSSRKKMSSCARILPAVANDRFWPIVPPRSAPSSDSSQPEPAVGMKRPSFKFRLPVFWDSAMGVGLTHLETLRATHDIQANLTHVGVCPIPSLLQSASALLAHTTRKRTSACAPCESRAAHLEFWVRPTGPDRAKRLDGRQCGRLRRRRKWQQLAPCFLDGDPSPSPSPGLGSGSSPGSSRIA